jgi:spore coat polysaccharide biosynthesis protein SpsF
MKSVAIIQARMGSSRLPGKMLKHLAGKPLIWHLIHRLQGCTSVDEIVLATTTDKDDDALTSFGEEAGLKVVRGEASDVLGRFTLGAEVSGADTIVRVNGDAPLIDAGFIDAQVAALKAQDADFVTLAEGTPCIHDGVDAMSRRALDFMMTQAREDPVAVEHVSGYIKLHPDTFKIGLFKIPEVLRWDGARLSIDTPADLAFMERLYRELGAAAGEASLAEASRLLQSRPDLVALNAHVKQKALVDVHGTVLIRVDGGGRLGFGHIMRTLAIGGVLRDELGYGVVFAMDGAGDLADGADYVEAQGFPVVRRTAAKEVDWLLDICAQRKPGSVLFDIRTNLSADDVVRIRSQVEKTVTLDDGSDRRLVADVAILPPVPQVDTLDWTGAKGAVITDWDHVVLSSRAVGPQIRRGGGPVKLLVNFGGSDPFALTLPAAELVAKLAAKLDCEVAATFVFGPGVGDVEARIREVEACSPDFKVLAAPDDFAALAASHDLALIAYGVTAWELAHAGVPSILICLDDDQFASAGAFEREGIATRALMIPVEGEKGAVPDIKAALIAWLENPDKRRKVGAKSASLIDGKGASRVASTMLWGQTPGS